MSTGAFFAALGYRFWIQEGTTSSTAPTSSTGMTELLSLTDASVNQKSDITDIIDYGSPKGFKAKLVTGQSYSIPMELHIDLTSPGYALLHHAALNSGTGVTVMWYRESPLQGTATTPEKYSGVAFVSDLVEDVKAGGVATVKFSLEGYGQPVYSEQV